MKTKIFVDGSEGTTGLRIFERFEGREDITLLKIDPELRKDPAERKRLINESDITFLCLPDAAAIESVSLLDPDNDHTRILDTSTAHRTDPEWAYGFPELSKEHREKIRTGQKVAVPGCHASGFVALIYPMVAGGYLPADYPVSAFSLTGYSGGGKKMIAEYEADERATDLNAPREYALTQKHKHLKEMKAVCGLERAPLFSPIVSDYYSGMLVSAPFYADLLKKSVTVEQLHAYFTDYYKDSKFVQVMPLGEEANMHGGMLAGNTASGFDGMRIFVTGNEERLMLHAQFDNLGKGASGAAVQCLNIMLGCEEDKGLQL